MGQVLYRDVSIARENSELLDGRDVLVEDGEVKQISESGLDVEPDQTVDSSGMILIPGLFDFHVHLREPGREDTETIQTGTEAAINGGVTGLLAMPNTDPAVDTGSMVDFILDIADDDSRIPIHTSGCITKGREGDELAEIGDMHDKGAPLITDDGNPVGNPRVLRRAMEYAKGFDLIVAEHCEIPELSLEGAVNEGPASYRLGLPGQPAISEEICIERDIKLAQLTETRFHVHHLSTEEGLRSVERAKERGLPVTTEVTPHHLLFSEDDLDSHDTSLKMNPPLRTESDREALLEGLKEGSIDLIATDHAPHAAFEKRQDFNSAPFGIMGLETALLSLFDRFISEGDLSWQVLVRSFSSKPRELLGLDPVPVEEGESSNFLLFDPEGSTEIKPDYLRSKSQNTPFLNQTLSGRIKLVQRNEEVLLDRDNLLESHA